LAAVEGDDGRGVRRGPSSRCALGAALTLALS